MRHYEIVIEEGGASVHDRETGEKLYEGWGWDEYQTLVACRRWIADQGDDADAPCY